MDSEKLLALQKLCVGCVVNLPGILNDHYFKTFDSACFTHPVWEEVFRKCQALYKANGSLSYVTVATESDLDIATVANLEYFMTFNLPDLNKWKDYFGSLVRMKVRHDVLEILERYGKMLMQGTEIERVIPSLTQDVLGLGHLGAEAFSHSPTRFSGLEMSPSDVHFGAPTVDRELRYLGTGKLILVGGRPGWGKSVLAQMGIAGHAEAGMNSALFSFEMSQSEVDRRLFSIVSGIPLEETKSGNVTDNGELARIYNHFWVFDGSEDIDCLSVCAKIEALHAEVGLKSVYFDYLQMAVTGGINRKQSLAEYSRALKKMAGRTGVNVYLLAQLNRGCINDGRKPSMQQDIAECDNIYQDADLAVAIYPNCANISGNTDEDRAGSMRKMVDGRFAETSVIDVQKFRDGKPFKKCVENDLTRVRFLPIEGEYDNASTEN